MNNDNAQTAAAAQVRAAHREQCFDAVRVALNLGDTAGATGAWLDRIDAIAQGRSVAQVVALIVAQEQAYLQAHANALAACTGSVRVTVTDRGLTATSLTGERAEAYHDHLATLWAAYNSRSGRASNAQVERIKRQLSIDDLVRMLTARRVVVPPPPAPEVR
jgi:hypothetical protein